MEHTQSGMDTSMPKKSTTTSISDQIIGDGASKKPEKASIHQKECKKCHQIKAISEFNLNKNCLDGHEGQCKTCKYDSYKANVAFEKRKEAARMMALKLSKTDEKPVIEAGSKRCSLCKLILPIELFNRNKSCPDGYKYYCRTCERKKTIQRRNNLESEKVNVIDKQKESPDSDKAPQGFGILPNELPSGCTIPALTGIDDTVQSFPVENTPVNSIVGDEEILDECEVERSHFESWQVKFCKQKVISINFESFPELYKLILDISAGEFRTPDMQCLYWLDRIRQYVLKDTSISEDADCPR